MNDPRIRLKNRFLAVVLAWMLPGAGHLYQGRRFKSAIYFCSIAGLWVMAMHLSEWKVMAAPFSERNERPPMIEVLKFGAQSGVGLPAVAAVVQRERVKDDENKPVHNLSEEFEADFVGTIRYTGDTGVVDGPVTGTVAFEPTEGQFGATLAGRFAGTTEEGTSLEVELGEGATLGRPVDGEHRRGLTSIVVDGSDAIGELKGSIPRSLGNWLFVPLNVQQEMTLHRRLGKYHELATLLSVVAGLLNILALFDAYGGPAYGYGDEDPKPAPEPAPA